MTVKILIAQTCLFEHGLHFFLSRMCFLCMGIGSLHLGGAGVSSMGSITKVNPSVHDLGLWSEEGIIMNHCFLLGGLCSCLFSSVVRVHGFIVMCLSI